MRAQTLQPRVDGVRGRAGTPWKPAPRRPRAAALATLPPGRLPPVGASLLGRRVSWTRCSLGGLDGPCPPLGLRPGRLGSSVSEWNPFRLEFDKRHGIRRRTLVPTVFVLQFRPCFCSNLIIKQLFIRRAQPLPSRPAAPAWRLGAGVRAFVLRCWQLPRVCGVLISGPSELKEA